MKKILVPVDFTEYSNNALKVAVYIAGVKGMSIKLVNIVEEPTTPVFIYGLPESYIVPEPDNKYMEGYLTNTLENLSKIAGYAREKNVEVDYEVITAKSGIAKEITKQEADLIVIGTRRSGSGPGLLLGSVAEKVIRLSSVPVITVGELYGDFHIKHILFASDFEEPEAAPIIERIIKFADIFEAQLHFLTVDTDGWNEAMLEKILSQKIKKFNLQGYKVHVMQEGDKEKGILHYAEEIGADIISLCTHGRTGLRHFFLGSIAEDIALDSEIPVLIYNINPKKIDKVKKHITRDSIRRHRVGKNQVPDKKDENESL